MYPADSADETMTTGDHHSREGLQMKISLEHGNWLTVTELIRAVQKPVSIYAEEIVKAFHENLCNNLLRFGKCSSPDDCNQKTKPADICPTCQQWFNELGNSHEKGKNPFWHKNCNSARWSEDHWELAKFFMPALGDNLSTVKDAESTDLPSLLNVLEWMKDTAFLGKTRVNIDLVRKLRSKVRNTWAHEPKQEFTYDEKDESFSIATQFLEDLEKVFPRPENGECLKHLKELNDNGVTNVVESEKHSSQLLLVIARELTSCLPEKVPMFTAREAEIQKVISLLMEEEKAIVSLHGGHGFGKTSIAVEVSLKVHAEKNILVIFSQLSTATTIEEMTVRLCCDVGVNYESDSKSSFILWLKNLKHKVVFVFDDIDNLLEKEKKTHLFEFLRLMRKNSNQHCQIVTTSSEFYTIPELSADSASVNVGEMDDISAIQLLKQRCPYQDDEFLRELSRLCGHIPLAMCIAASRVVDFEDPNELLQYLEKQPMKILESPESNLSVHRAINMSYEKLDNETKEALVRLVVFEGTFSEAAAMAVIERETLDTKRILKDLLHRSLIEKPIQHRYVIHFLISRFLLDQLESAENISHTKTLMVGFYLDLGHDLTIKSYSKDGYKDNRENLKKEAHNIQNVLKMCCREKDTNSDISSSLTSSRIYNSSARSFTNFVRTVIPLSILDKFLQFCANLAKVREELAIKINFDCLLAERGRCKSIGKSDEYYKMMEKIEEEFDKHYEKLKEDRQLCANYYYQYGRFLSETSDHNQDLVTKAGQQHEKSLRLIKEDSTHTSEEQVDKVHSFLQLGNVWKIISRNEHYHKRREAYDKAKITAENYYKQAMELSREYLGEHDLTTACYKTAGDYFLVIRSNDKAHDCYTIAKEMRERLGLDASEEHVYLLNNLAKCLTYSNRLSEAIELLEKTCDMAEKLAETDKPNICKAKVYTSLAIAHNRKECNSEDAVKYAKKALAFDKIDKAIKKYELKEIEQIVKSGNAE